MVAPRSSRRPHGRSHAAGSPRPPGCAPRTGDLDDVRLGPGRCRPGDGSRARGARAQADPLLADLDSVLGPAAVIATNASSLPVTSLAESTDRGRSRWSRSASSTGARHRLVEVVTTRHSDEAVVAGVRELACRWARRRSSSATGPDSWRTGCCSATSGTRAPARRWTVTRESLDAALVASGMPMGPLGLLDLIGSTSRCIASQYSRHRRCRASRECRRAWPRSWRPTTSRTQVGPGILGAPGRAPRPRRHDLGRSAMRRCPRLPYLNDALGHQSRRLRIPTTSTPLCVQGAGSPMAPSRRSTSGAWMPSWPDALAARSDGDLRPNRSVCCASKSPQVRRTVQLTM